MVEPLTTNPGIEGSELATICHQMPYFSHVQPFYEWAVSDLDP